MKRLLSALSLALLLAGCDQLGIDTPAKQAALKESEGKAIGSACRHAMRAIEDCYTLNPKALKSAVYAGWREMDEYMRDNKIEGIAPVVPRPEAKKAKPADEETEVVEPKASEAKPPAKEASKEAGKDTGKGR
jgi:hypothetical protein